MLRSKFPDIPYPEDISLWQFIQVFNSQHLQRLALVEHETGRQYTYRDVFINIRKIRSGLYNLGVRKGDVVLTCASNNIDTPLTYFAVWSLGAVIAGCNHECPTDALEHYITDSKAKWIVTIPANVNRFQELNKKYNNQIKGILVYDNKAEAPEGSTSFSSLLTNPGPPAPAVSLQPREDLAAIVYTSGTTGLAKGVLLTHYTLLVCNRQFSHQFIYPEEEPATETCVLFLNFYGNWPLTICIQCFSQAQTIIMMPKFDLVEYLKVIQQYKVTKLHILPSVAALIARHPDVSNYDLSSVRTILSGCAVLSVQLAKELKTRLPHTNIRSGFGMLETSGCTMLPLRDDIKPGSIGVLLPDVKVKIIDINTGEVCGANQPGEMWIHTPGLMKGYLNRPQEYAKAVDSDRWLHTGDYCVYDEDEHIYVLCRIVELLHCSTKQGTRQFAPVWFEDILAEHPSVLEVAVVGISKAAEDMPPDHIPTAFVVTKQGHNTSKQELRDFINNSDKLPKNFEGHVEVVITPEIPRSDAYKVLKRVLLDQVKK